MPKRRADSLANRMLRWSGLGVRLLPDVAAALRRPILVAGLARSGTTWVATVLSRTPRVRYLHEPFNATNVAGAASLSYRYLPGDAADAEFDAHCPKAFSGRVEGPYLLGNRVWPRNKLSRWPGRTLVKDVDVCLALERVQVLRAPRIVIVVRHPCAVAASWSRLGFPVDGILDRIRAQPRLMQERLGAFEHLFAERRGFWQGMGLLWGVCHRIMVEQLRRNPDWKLVRHEDFCLAPEERFRELYHALGLRWTSATDEFLRESGTLDSGKPYVPHRVTERESEKWRSELTEEQASDVVGFAEELLPLARLDAQGAVPGATC
jgi:hypothetical protein